MSTRRLRVLHVIVQPVLVWDDGETLTPGPQASPVQLPVAEVATLAERLPAEIANLQAQADAAKAAAEPPA